MPKIATGSRANKSKIKKAEKCIGCDHNNGGWCNYWKKWACLVNANCQHSTKPTLTKKWRKKAVQAMQIKFRLFNHYVFFIIRKSNRKEAANIKKPKHEYIPRLSNYQKAQARIAEVKQFIKDNEQTSRRNHGVY